MPNSFLILAFSSKSTYLILKHYIKERHSIWDWDCQVHQDLANIGKYIIKILQHYYFYNLNETNVVSIGTFTWYNSYYRSDSSSFTFDSFSSNSLLLFRSYSSLFTSQIILQNTNFILSQNILSIFRKVKKYIENLHTKKIKKITIFCNRSVVPINSVSSSKESFTFIQFGF